MLGGVSRLEMKKISKHVILNSIKTHSRQLYATQAILCKGSEVPEQAPLLNEVDGKIQ